MLFVEAVWWEESALTRVEFFISNIDILTLIACLSFGFF